LLLFQGYPFLLESFKTVSTVGALPQFGN